MFILVYNGNDGLILRHNNERISGRLKFSPPSTYNVCTVTQ